MCVRVDKKEIEKTSRDIQKKKKTYASIKMGAQKDENKSGRKDNNW